MEKILKEIIESNSIEYNKEESQDRAFIYVDDFINELQSKFKLLDLHKVIKSVCRHCGCKEWHKQDDGYNCNDCGNDWRQTVS